MVAVIEEEMRCEEELAQTAGEGANQERLADPDITEEFSELNGTDDVDPDLLISSGEEDNEKQKQR